ncbi:PREDICTED: kxDL motif-containing protein 1-like [Priapulus caudatus]|uniref:KxDL motif-containing protein 1-like n=1 Tax=Priapulus caudatus TaxID=37621 RepID=A0ABM1EKT3_PRICU|nr:PREDICTED: kxDL motif-containing protein 1-like [Priapulus caudatus]
MLVNCNALAAARVDYAHLEFRRHTQLLVEMKKDLDIVFRRIRKLKVNLGKRYPEAFAACSPVGSPDDEEDPSHPSVGAQPPGREVASRDAVQGRSATASAKDLASTRSLSATS